MPSSVPNGDHPDPVYWDEAREIIVIVLLVSVAAMVFSPMAARLIDGQLDREGLGSALTGVQPVTGLALLAAAVLVASTPRANTVPALRKAVYRLAFVIVTIGVVAILDILLSPTAGGFRPFLTRFVTILRFSGPGTLMAATAGWTARRVALLPGG